MKANLVFVCVILNLWLTWSGRGQSSFRFNNYNPPEVNARVFDAQGVPLEGPNYVGELWGGIVSDSLTPARGYYSGQRIIIAFRTGSGAGIVRDSYAGRDEADHPTVLGVTPLISQAWLQVRAWDLRLGATYEDVAALGIGGYGGSPLFTAFGSDPGVLFAVGAPLTGLQSFRLLPVVPEPSTWALLALGGTALWAFRRLPRGRS